LRGGKNILNIIKLITIQKTLIGARLLQGGAWGLLPPDSPSCRPEKKT